MEKSKVYFGSVQHGKVAQIACFAAKVDKITDILIHSVDDMQVPQDDNTEAVSLIGWLPDQSALLGLLNTLNDIR